MVDFLKIVRQKTLLSEVAYYSLNAGLVLVLLVLSQTIQSATLAIIVVLISKWRVLAVRPRYWWTNIQANSVDIIVGVSLAALMYLPNATFVFQVAMVILYAVWLFAIKPLSKKHHMLIQALISIGLGVTTLYSVSYDWPVVAVVLMMAVIGYGAARHFLYGYEEDQIVLLSGIWGLLFAEIGWLAYYWTFAYNIMGAAMVKLPQVTIIVLLMSFIGERVYRSWAKNGQVIVGDALMPSVFSVLLIGSLLLFFNSVAI